MWGPTLLGDGSIESLKGPGGGPRDRQDVRSRYVEWTPVPWETCVCCDEPGSEGSRCAPPPIPLSPTHRPLPVDRTP